MVNRRCFLTVVLLLCVCGAAEAQNEAGQYIPSGSVRVDVMQLMASPRLVEIAQKLAAAVTRDRDWWMSYASSAKEGEALPFDPRMGITSDEYAEFLGLSGKLSLQKADEAVLGFQWSQSDRITLDGGDFAPEITGTVIDLAGSRVITPFGTLSEFSAINNTIEDGPTGPWVGVDWKRTEVADDYSSGIAAEVAFGRLQRGDRGIMIYDVKVIRDSKQVVGVDLILTYDLQLK